MKKLLLFSFLLLSLSAQGSTVRLKADLVLRHGRIYTMDAARSWAESLALRKGRIVYVGDDKGIAPWIADSTAVIELSDRFVLPGFIDSHVHPLEAGIAITQCSIDTKETKGEILDAVKDYAESHPDAEWIMGSGWQLPAFPEANPQKEWLDAIVPDRPVLMTAADGHSAWVNSRALELAGITKDTPDPENGRIERNSQGEPSGTLRESAADVFYRLAPKPTLEERITGLQQALWVMNRFGITGFQDASVIESGLKTYLEADKRGLLTARVTAAMYANPEGSLQEVLDQVQKFIKYRTQFKTGRLQATAVKVFEDGVIEAGTAAMLQPYLDRGNDAGKLIWGPEKLNPFVELLDREKFQTHVHAIGDRAIRVALTAFEAAQKVNGPRDGRPLIAHLELIDPNDIPRFAQLSVIPVFQPLWAYEDAYISHLTLPKLSPDRARWLYPIGSTSKTGATMAMGSDWNVSSVNPLDGIEVAVTRQDFDASEQTKPPFYLEERLDLKAALAAYTIGSAYANFWEKETGSIETGKSADVIVLSENLFTIPPDKINETKVLLTILEGKVVYRDPYWRP